MYLATEREYTFDGQSLDQLSVVNLASSEAVRNQRKKSVSTTTKLIKLHTVFDAFLKPLRRDVATWHTRNVSTRCWVLESGYCECGYCTPPVGGGRAGIY